MIRIAIVGDSHADQWSRFAEHNRIMSWIGRDAAARGVSLYLHAGDVWERKSTSTERLAVADWVREWTAHAPLVVVAGNHDDPLDVEWLGRLRTEHQIHAVTRPEIVCSDGVAVACLPWPRPAHLLAELGPVSQEAGNQAATDALRSILRGLGGDMDDVATGRARIFLGHVMARGSRTSTGQEMVGAALELGLEDLALARAEFYAMGHIHLAGPANEWSIGTSVATYTGSPRRCSYGEPEEKSYLVVQVDGGRVVGWERVPTPATRMAHVEAHWHGAHTGLPGDVTVPAGLSRDWSPEEVAGAEVRLRYVVEAPNREAAKRDAAEEVDALRAAGAVSVKVEEQVMASTRARTPEVARAVTLADKLGALWEARKDVPDPVRRAALVSKLGELEGAA